MTTKVEAEDKVIEEEVVETPETPDLTEDEKLAVSKGWKNEEDWVKDGGKAEDWKPAKVFNEIGTLKEQLGEKEKETKKLNKVVTLMKEHHLHVRELAIKEAMDKLKAERVAALEKENFAEAEKVRDKMDELRTAAARDGSAGLPKEVAEQIKEDTKEPDPEFFKFLDRNPWYKPGGKDEISKKADTLGYSYHLQNPEWTFGEVIKQVEADVKKLYPEKFNRPNTPVNEPGSRTGSPSSSSGSVKLNAAEKEAARQFGMSEAEYAKELQSYRGR